MDEKTLDWLLDHHRESYRYQLEQRERVFDRAAFLSSPLTLLGGGIIYLFTHYPGDSNFWYLILFYSAIGLATALFAISLFLIMFPVFWRFKYYSILNPSELQTYANEMIVYASRVEGVDVLSKIKRKLVDRYSDAATRNWYINNRQSDLISRGMQACLFSFLSLLISLLPFFRNTL